MERSDFEWRLHAMRDVVCDMIARENVDCETALSGYLRMTLMGLEFAVGHLDELKD